MIRLLLVPVVLLGCRTLPTPAPTPAPEPEPAKEVVEARPAPEPEPAPPPAPKSLFDRLGGLDAITAVVEEFVGRTTTDPRIKERFFNTDATNLKKLLVEFVCLATGGPCTYTGRDMPSSHAGMELVEEEWTALVEDLIAALDKFQVPAAEKGELLGALGPLKPSIVTPPEKLQPIAAAELDKVTKHAATIEDPDAVNLLALARTAGERGQRSYAEQLFTRAEMAVGAKVLAPIAKTFRAGAPPSIATAPKKFPDPGAQPAMVGGSEAEDPKPKAPAKGSLTGTLTLEGRPVTAMGVVMLWPEKGGAKQRTPKQRVIEQRGKQFAPQLMAVPVGSTVTFPNFDPIFHNVFSLSKAKPFDLGMYKTGETREVKVDKPGIVRLGCNIHANMSAHLIVVDAPHYVVVQNGSFEFKSLAPGKYKVKAWTERSADPVETTVVIGEGRNQATFDVKAGAAQLGPDKFGVAREAAK